MTLLLTTGKLCVALIDDHIQQRIAHVLRRDLPQRLPLGTAFIVAKLDLVRINGAEERVKLEIVDLALVHAHLFAPIIEEPNPITECPDLEYFSWHHYSSFCSPQRTERSTKLYK